MYKIPVSNGEIADKYTILTIKERHMEGEKLANVSKEKGELTPFMEEMRSVEGFEEAEALLLRANEQLWKVEDCIRYEIKMERYEECFIELAKMVPELNGARFEIKTRINQITGSELVEEKTH